jgi:hypothetical protein
MEFKGGMGIMVKKLLVIVVVLSLLAALLPLNAQDALPEGCTAEALTTLTDNLTKATDAANTAIAAGDLKGAIEGLNAAQLEVTTLGITCSGLSWEGKAAKVIGPVVIPEGVYRAKTTTTGAMIAQLTVTDGECGVGNVAFLQPTLFLLMPGSATDGAEEVLTSTGCTTLIGVSNVQGDWTLSLEKVG